MTAHEPVTDGRSARRARNRDAVLEAVLDSISSGAPIPTMQRVAVLAGLSERSVFRYFEDMDDLLGAVFESARRRFAHLAMIEGEGTGSRAERIESLIEQRSRLWQGAGAAAASIWTRGIDNEALIQRFVGDRDRLRAQLELHLGDYLGHLTSEDRARCLRMIDVVLTYEAFRSMLADGMTLDELEASWRYAIDSLIGA